MKRINLRKELVLLIIFGLSMVNVGVALTLNKEKNMKTVVMTQAAPAAIGPYSQAIRNANTIYLSGQIALDPQTMNLVPGGIEKQAVQVFKNLRAVCEAAGAELNQIVKLTIYLTDLNSFDQVNEVMKTFFTEPYPARATIQVSALPKAAQIEVDAIVAL